MTSVLDPKKYDLIVIGGGSGGVRSARIAGAMGKKVALCEYWDMGGTCVNRGCIPKKLSMYASQFADHFQDATDYGWDIHVNEFSWSHFVEIKKKEISRLNTIYKSLLENASVDIYEGKGFFTSGNTVQVKDNILISEKIIIATGGKPFLPNIPGIEHAITSDDIFDLTTLPKKVIVVGAGYIAIETASFLNNLGVDVTIIIRKDQILRGFDDEVRAKLSKALSERDIKFKFLTQINSIEKEEDILKVHLDNGGFLNADHIFYATGRVPNINELSLDKAGVEITQKGSIIVNKDYQTSNKNIYAVGDVTDRVNLTPVALEEGQALVTNLFSDQESKVSYDYIPTAVFSLPHYGCAGLTEEEARSRGEVDIYASEFRSLKYTLTSRQEKTFIKLIVDQETQYVIGFHMVGEEAPEIAQIMAVLMKNKMTKQDLDKTIGLHPTVAEEIVTLRQKRKA